MFWSDFNQDVQSKKTKYNAETNYKTSLDPASMKNPLTAQDKFRPPKLKNALFKDERNSTFVPKVTGIRNYKNSIPTNHNTISEFQ
jgi:hypothetical protein